MEAINIASNRVSNAELKSLNDKFSTDHRKMHDELMTLAQRKGVSLTDEDYSRPNRQIRKLSDEDKDFDKEYLALMEEEHEDAVRLFEKAATDCKDTEIREFAGKHLPTLREHLTKIRDSKRNLR